MEGLSWKCLTLLVVFGFCSVILAAPAGDQSAAEANYELSPITNAEQDGYTDGLEREKRKLPDPGLGFGAKNAILGYVFGENHEGTHARVTRATPVSATTDDTPDFDRSMVSLDIPDELFGSSFNTVTNISKIFGSLIMNSARRYSQFMQYLKPVLGKALTVKGVNPPPPTTTESNSIDA